MTRPALQTDTGTGRRTKPIRTHTQHPSRPEATSDAHIARVAVQFDTVGEGSGNTVPLPCSQHKVAKAGTGCDTGRRPPQGEASHPNSQPVATYLNYREKCGPTATALHIRAMEHAPEPKPRLAQPTHQHTCNRSRSILNLPASISSFTCLPLNGFTYY